MNDWVELLQNDDYIGIKQHIANGASLSIMSEQQESILCIAMRLRCSEQTLKLLVDSGANLFDKDLEGVSVLEVAITYNSFFVAQKAIDAGADVTKTDRFSGFTPLMAAVCYNRRDLVELLLSHGADQHSKDRLGLDAQGYAKKTHRKKILKLLQTGGVDAAD